jgi:hypothetical protein
MVCIITLALLDCASAHARIPKTEAGGPPQGRPAAPDRRPCRRARPAAPHLAADEPGEAGSRISASRLYQLCRILGVGVGFFYDGLDPAHAGNPGFAETSAEPFESDPLRQRETIDLVEAYYAIRDPAVRRRLFELARQLAAKSGRSSDS